MATSENVILKGVSGHLNKQIVIKQWGDKTIIAKYPDMSRRKFSKKQLKLQYLMKGANATAKATIANEKSRNAALVRLNVTRNRLYTALIKEYFANTK